MIKIVCFMYNMKVIECAQPALTVASQSISLMPVNVLSLSLPMPGTNNYMEEGGGDEEGKRDGEKY